MKTIAILCGRYLPGFKDGGPVRSVVNLVHCLGSEYQFRIITNDRDHGDRDAYHGIRYGMANRVGNADVWYLKPKGFTVKNIRLLTDEADLLYVCGPYNDYAYKTMLMKRFGLIKKPVVVASMGVFSEGAFQIKSEKKRLYVSVLKRIGCFKKISWSVTSEIELMELQKIVGKDQRCQIAEDLPRTVPELRERQVCAPLKIVFLSRISRKKNLQYAIRILQNVRREIIFDIYGNIEDNEYWRECEMELEKMPTHIHWRYCGVADAEQVISVFSEYDVFLFPTLGENYGHVIFEALAGGCIPVISDCTPWMDLEKKHCGKALPVNDMDGFSKEIERIAGLESDEVLRMRHSANEYAKEKYRNSVRYTGYRKIFG